MRLPDLPAGVTVHESDSALRVEIGKGASLAEPLRFACASTSEVELHADAGSRAVVIVLLEGADATRHSMKATLGDGAHVELVTLQMLDASAQCDIVQEGTLGARALCQWRNATLGGAKVRHHLSTRTVGSGATSSVEWLFFARGTEEYVLSARNAFDAVDGAGEMLMQGVAEDRAHVAANGLIDIGLHGGGTNTYLTQSVLMLDPTCRVDAIPGLEIKTNDVKASHSATVSRVTPEDLFYFGSRGIPSREARRMFVEGFIGQLADHIGDEESRTRARTFIERKYDAAIA